MAMVSAAAELAARGIAVGLIHPGWVRTDMGGANAPVSAQASVAGIRRVIEALDASRSGGFWDYQARSLPW
jgi:NAD(P)-dependent dehydrogenase (short-subunit alcohol dehydrogenase family)